MNNGKIEYSYELYIAAPPEQVWKGLIDADSRSSTCTAPASRAP